MGAACLVALLVVTTGCSGGSDDSVSPATTDLEADGTAAATDSESETAPTESAAPAIPLLGSPDDGICILTPEQIEAALGVQTDVLEGDGVCSFASFDGPPQSDLGNVTSDVRPITVAASADEPLEKERQVYLSQNSPWREAVEAGSFQERPEWGEGAFLFTEGLPTACFPHVAWQRVCINTLFELGDTGTDGAVAALEALIGTLDGAP